MKKTTYYLPFLHHITDTLPNFQIGFSGFLKKYSLDLPFFSEGPSQKKRILICIDLLKIFFNDTLVHKLVKTGF